MLNDSEESRPIDKLQKARSFGGVYPENIEGPQDDMGHKSLEGERLRSMLARSFP